MDEQKNIKSNQIQDLVDEAVNNATERRKKAREMSDLSIEELEGIQGGLQPTTGRWTTSGIVSPELF